MVIPHEIYKCGNLSYGSVSLTGKIEDSFAVFMIYKIRERKVGYVIWGRKTDFSDEKLFFQVRTLLVVKYNVTKFFFAIKEESPYEGSSPLTENLFLRN